MKDIRDELIDALRREIIGPSPNPEYIDEETGEEILLKAVHGSPASRYGAGMLYPQYIPSETMPDEESELNSPEELSEEEIPEPEVSTFTGSLTETGSEDEEPVSLAHQFKPSALGFTIRIKTKEADSARVKIYVKSAYYIKGKGTRVVKKREDTGEVSDVCLKNQEPFESEYWIRRPIEVGPVILDLAKLSKSHAEPICALENGKPWLNLVITDRSTKKDLQEGFRTITFSLVNEIKSTSNTKSKNQFILYQNQLSLIPENPNLIAPLREKFSPADTEEEMEMKLLYRNKPVYAIGHGISVVWQTDENGNITEISSSVLPVYEMPQIAPTQHVELCMYELSDLGDWKKALDSLSNLIEGYEQWVNEIENIAQNSPELENYREAAINNAKRCRKTLERIRNGVDILKNSDINSPVVKAFRWMNHAMLWQQQRSKVNLRKWKKNKTDDGAEYILEGINGTENKLFESLQSFHKKGYGRWRPFQLAFILMNIESVMNPASEERKIVDLIWFPTGGGKTEAYLGLAAFTIFYRRLRGEEEFNGLHYGGTTVIMRYTLRLLTAQQYERAASLIAGCELIRQKNESILGDEPISIGLWVGGASTPNSNSDAVKQYNKLQNEKSAEYNFVVMKCPACGAQIGKLDEPGKSVKIKGIGKADGKQGRIILTCENMECEYFNKKLPLEVVDEYIYENPPTLLLGTVDKFAMVTWKEEAGNFFGFRTNDKGKIFRINPAELIIQDELHLISGPLGTMVGLYETMIQTLCNDYGRSEPPFWGEEFNPPKIVASTATISRAYEQVKNLYAIDSWDKLSIFPPQGLSFGNTWFSEEKPISEEFPSRKYVGLLAPGYPSMQTTIVRTYAAILQKVGELAAEFYDRTEDFPVETNNSKIDFYWTLLGYFNSIRELGGAASLVFADIRERLSQIQYRELLLKEKRRFVRKFEELTSRMPSSEIPNILKKLETRFEPGKEKNQAIDICLATNMVATGVDVSRLGLMVIHGQPKTTAEYIQASSRVGRKVPEGPGLIITLYSPSKPRDKSQYEHFFSYHGRIYSYVEPTSVTPYSVSARQRGLHGVLIGLMRHFSASSLRQSPAIVDESEFEYLSKQIENIILERCKLIDPAEFPYTNINLNEYIDLWKNGFEHYGDPGNYGILKNRDYIPLMYAPGNEIRNDIIKKSLPTPTSMRNVDNESRIEIFLE